MTLFATGAPVPYSEAFFASEGGLAVRFAHPSRSRHAYVPEWLSFNSVIHDPVCPPRRLPDVAVRTTASATWQTVVNVLQARAEREATQRMAQVVSVRSRVTGVGRRDPRHVTVAVETTMPDDGTWRAVYVFDERSSAILAAHYERTSQ